MRKEVFVPVALLLAWWAISLTRSPTSPKTVQAQSSEAPRAPASISPAPTQKSATGAPTMAAPTPQTKDGSSAMSRPFEFEKELHAYLGLHSKLFLSAQEKQEKDGLLHHKGLLKELGRRLVEPTRSTTAMTEQDAAIDFLMEALKSGDAQAASEVLQMVVKDGQVENTHLDRSAREQLAGLKAEVLYQWSATAPDMVGNLQSWLPGPVSQKIWANVVRMQQSNRADSEAEARAMSH